MRGPALALDSVVGRVVSNLDTAIATEASASNIDLEPVADDECGESGKAIYTELIERWGFPYVCVEPPEGSVETSRSSAASELTMWVLLAFQTAEQGASGRIAASYLSALASVFMPDCTANMDTRVVEVTCSPSFPTDQETFVRVVGVRVKVKTAE